MLAEGTRMSTGVSVQDDEHHLRPDVRQSRVDLVLERLHHPLLPS